MCASETRRCPQCGNLQAEGEFCERCGTRFPEAGPAPTPPGPGAGVTAPPPEPPAAAAPAPGSQTGPSTPPPMTGGYAPQGGQYPPGAQYGPYASGPAGGGGGYQPPAQYGYAPGWGAPPPPPERPQGVGFLGSLFDLSFRHFITPRMISLLFILSLIGVGLWALVMIVYGFTVGAGTGFLTFILALIFVVLGVLFSRLYLELVVVLFRIAENTGELVDQGKHQ